jgi:hypothetical protein
MSEPKPCPFCGSKAKKHKYHILGELVKLIYCPNENCHFHHRTASVADWNTRPIEDALLARAEQAEAMVERLIEAGNVLIETFQDYPDFEEYPEVGKWDTLVAEWKEREE